MHLFVNHLLYNTLILIIFLYVCMCINLQKDGFKFYGAGFTPELYGLDVSPHIIYKLTNIHPSLPRRMLYCVVIHLVYERLLIDWYWPLYVVSVQIRFKISKFLSKNHNIFLENPQHSTTLKKYIWYMYISK